MLALLCRQARRLAWCCRQTLTNVKLTGTLVELIKAHGLEKGCSKEKGALVMIVGSTFPAVAMRHRPLLMDYILTDRIVTNDQCNGAMKYFKTVKDGDIVVTAFEKAAGVGIVVSDADVAAAVAEVLQENAEALVSERYHFNTMKLLQPIKNIGDMAWADIGKVKAELASQTEAILGPKTAEDEKPREKPKKTKAPKPEKVPPQTCARSPGRSAATAEFPCPCVQRAAPVRGPLCWVTSCYLASVLPHGPAAR